jgi:hypothetical protein
MKKLYVPYDYRVMMRGYYEIEVDDIDYDDVKYKINNGEYNVSDNGTKQDAKELFRFDEYIINEAITETDYQNDEYLSGINTERGFKPDGNRMM